MAPGIPVLTFHALDDGASVLAFPPRRFARAIDDLVAAGWRAASLGEVVAALDGADPLPERVFAVTFDDGYRSVYEQAFPVLARHGVPATVFVATGDEAATSDGRLPPMQGRARLSWSEMREMREYGVEFGSHTLAHPDLTRLGNQAIDRELRLSKARLEEALARPVRWFAYPFGRYDRRSRDIAAGLYEAAWSDRLGLARRRDDRHALPRVETHYLRGEGAFAGQTNRRLAARLAVHAVPRRLRRMLASR